MDVGIVLGFCDVVLDGDKYGMLEGSTLGVPLGTPEVILLVTDGGIVLGSMDGEVLVSTLGAANGITPRLDEGTKLGSSVGSSEGCNDGKPWGSLLGESLGLYVGIVMGSCGGV